METVIQTKPLNYLIDIVLQELPSSGKHTGRYAIKAVAEAAEKIGRGVSLSEKELEVVVLAALLHETENNFQKESVYHSFVSEGISTQVIDQAYQCIKDLQPAYLPASLLQEVICDAHTSYMAADDYVKQAEYLQKGIKIRQDKAVSEQEWLTETIALFTKHRFYTPYALHKFAKGKEKNLKALQAKLQQPTNSNNELAGNTQKIKQKSKKSKDKKTDRGVETMFRTTMASHLQLSAMADNKANLMISINAIIISVMLSSLLHNQVELHALLVPILLLTFVCMLTIVFAMMSTRPTIKLKKKIKPLTNQTQTDLLFFGDFTQLNSIDYRKGIKKIMDSHKLLYQSMIDNIYSQGLVLSRKYRLLKIAYTVFMVGFLLVIVSSIITMVFFYNYA